MINTIISSIQPLAEQAKNILFNSQFTPFFIIEATALAFIALLAIAPLAKKPLSAIYRTRYIQNLIKSAKLISKYPLENAIYFTAIIAAALLFSGTISFIAPKTFDLIQALDFASFPQINTEISAITDSIKEIYHSI